MREVVSPQANLVAEWRELGLSPWTGEFLDPERESDARDYLGLTTGRQYLTIELLAALIIGALWWLDVADLGLTAASFATFALRWSLLGVWVVDRRRIPARPRLGIDGGGIFVGQFLAMVMIVVVSWFRTGDIAARQFEGYIIALAMLMLFANSARQRFALSALTLVCIDAVVVLQANPSADAVRSMIMDSISGWTIGAICSVILNSFRRRGFLHWLAERDARERLDAEIARRQEAELELVRLAEHDDLTGLPNRRAFFARAQRRIAEVAPVPACVLVLDADHFKRINDEHGHHVGDVALRHLARVLLELEPHGHIVGRLGGEEFGIAVEGTAEYGAAVAEEVRRRIAGDRFVVDGQVLRMTVSIGVAEARFRERFEDVLRRADAALYAAKREGRDCVRRAA